MLIEEMGTYGQYLDKLIGKKKDEKDEKDEKFESLLQDFKEECKSKYKPPALSGSILLFPEQKVKNTFVEMGESSLLSCFWD